MPGIALYIERCAALDEARFCREHPHPVFVHTSMSSSLQPAPDTRGMTMDRLVVEVPGAARARRAQPLGGAGLGASTSFAPEKLYTVFELGCKGAAEREATLGCSAECDVQIDDRSISKVHARFGSDGQRYRLLDNDSSAGTQVNEEPLEAGKWRELAAGDRVTLGFVDFIFLPAGDFYRFVRRLFIE